MQQAIAVGLFSYEDFISEVSEIRDATVRLQDYYRTRATQAGKWVDYYVELSACRNGDTAEIVVCRFHVGGGLTWEKSLEQVISDTANAMRFFRADLERRGIRVRPGVFAVAKEVEVVAPLPDFDSSKSGQ